MSENDQKCTSCYDNYYLENENCILIKDKNNDNKNEKRNYLNIKENENGKKNKKIESYKIYL